MRAIDLKTPGTRLAQWTWITDQITKSGFTGSYVDEIRLPGFNAEGERVRRLQVRDLKKVAPPRRVARYAQDMKNGDLFAPIIITRDGWIVDGNTRVEACRKIGRTTIHAFRLDVDYERATPIQKKNLTDLGAGMNEMNGEGMPAGRMRELIMLHYTEGDDAQKLAARLHYPVKAVHRVFKIMEGQRTIQRLGVEDPEGRLKYGHFELAGLWSPDKMTDPVVGNLFQLAVDASFTRAEVNALGRRVIALTTEVEKLDLIDTEKRANQARIDSGSRGAPSSSGKFRQGLGVILSFRNDPSTAAEPVDAEVMDREIREIKEARALLDTVLKEQYGCLAALDPQFIAPTLAR